MIEFNKKKINLFGKLKYIYDLIVYYKDWYVVIVNRLFNLTTKKIHLRNNITILGDANSLIIDLVDEIFIKNVYTPPRMKINSGNTVMDIGANIGVFSLYAALCGANKLYSIEPLTANLKLINKNFDINKFTRPIVINSAVSDKNKLGKLNIGELNPHGSLLNCVDTNKLKTYELTKMMTLDKIIDMYNINHIDFLKIDCEGSEGEIIRSINQKIYDVIDKISIEYHDNVSSLNHTEIIEKLNALGYKIELKSSDNIYGYIYAWKY